MTAAFWERRRHLAAAAAALTVIVALGVLVLACGAGTSDGWWPHTGRAFAADTRPAVEDPCDLIAGPAKSYCTRGDDHATPSGHHGAAGAAVRLVAAGAGLAGLAVWRRRSAPGRGRR